jgi:hypothetical protein
MTYKVKDLIAKYGNSLIGAGVIYDKQTWDITKINYDDNSISTKPSESSNDSGLQYYNFFALAEIDLCSESIRRLNYESQKTITLKESYRRHGDKLLGATINTPSMGNATVEILNIGKNGEITSIIASSKGDVFSSRNIMPYENIEIIKFKTTPQPKTPFHLLDLDFAAAMCENWQEGLKDGRVENGWKKLKSTNENINGRS